MAENCLVRFLKPTKDLETFDDLRLAAFNSNSLKMEFEKIQPMQESIFKGHIINNSYGYMPHLKMV